MGINVGNIVVSMYMMDRDEAVYTTAAHSLSHTDTVTLRRVPPKGSNGVLRSNLRFERGFPAVTATGTVEKPVTVSIAMTAPVGVVPADVLAYIAACCTQGAGTAGSLGTTGDIHLEATEE